MFSRFSGSKSRFEARRCRNPLQSLRIHAQRYQPPDIYGKFEQKIGSRGGFRGHDCRICLHSAPRPPEGAVPSRCFQWNSEFGMKLASLSLVGCDGCDVLSGVAPARMSGRPRARDTHRSPRAFVQDGGRWSSRRGQDDQRLMSLLTGSCADRMLRSEMDIVRIFRSVGGVRDRGNGNTACAMDSWTQR